MHPTYIKASNGEPLDLDDLLNLVQHALTPFHPFEHSITHTDKVIHIEWTDGPSIPELLPRVSGFETVRQETSTHLLVRKDFWLTRDGEGYLAEQHSTIHEGGHTPPELTDPPTPDAVLVQNAVPVTITIERKLSLLTYQAAFRHITNQAGDELEGVSWNPAPDDTGSNESILRTIPKLLVGNKLLAQLIIETTYSISYSDYISPDPWHDSPED